MEYLRVQYIATSSLNSCIKNFHNQLNLVTCIIVTLIQLNIWKIGASGQISVRWPAYHHIIDVCLDTHSFSMNEWIDASTMDYTHNRSHCTLPPRPIVDALSCLRFFLISVYCLLWTVGSCIAQLLSVGIWWSK